MRSPLPNARELIATRREDRWIRTLTDIAILTKRNLLLDLRNPEIIVSSALFPVFLLFVFTTSFAKVVFPTGTYADYAQFLVPLSVVQGLLFSCVNSGTTLYHDLTTNLDTRLRTLPIARSAVLAGRIAADAVRFLIQTLIIVAVGYEFGFRLQAGLLASLIFLILPVLFTTSFAWIALLIALKVKTTESIQALMFPWLLPLTFLSIGYVPKEGFPDWLQGFVAANPVSIVTQALRQLVLNRIEIGLVLNVLLWSGALTLIFCPLAIRVYQRREI
jgi:daunorubicin resistance protein C